MIKTFTATILALSIAFSSLPAAPAQAGKKNGDLGRLFVGAIALAIIGKAIQDNNRKNRQPAIVSQGRYPQYRQRQFGRYLPEQCFFRIRTQRSTRGVYGQVCLREFIRRADRLPQACLETIRVRYGRSAEVYGAKCLSRRGYQVAGWQR